MQFRDILNTKKFIFTFELVPARSSRTLEYKKILEFLEESVKHCLFDTFSITENPGGHPSLAPFALGSEIKKLGFDPIIHFSCKDKNRNEIESELFALDGVKLRNLLVITGDYPLHGFAGKAKPVFDLDSVQLLYLITLMEKKQKIPFLKGCVVNPFKLQVNEVWLQYFKLYKKFKAGAHFVITQSGFSPKKYQELILLLKKGITKTFAELLEAPELYFPEEDETFRKLPLIGSIIYPSSSIIKLLLKTEIPGIFMGKKIFKELESSLEREKKALEISAKLTAILKGLGYRGVHFCAFPLNYDKLLLFMEYYFLE
jgi:methylenetetrahydrofolate reductase (NADPH)